jgi:hypothetical protein
MTASAVRRFCPADRRATGVASNLSLSPMRTAAAVTSSRFAPTTWPQNDRFSPAVKSRYNPFAWPRKPTLDLTKERSASMSKPMMRAEPRESGRSPAHNLSNVVLPAPFGP